MRRGASTGRLAAGQPAVLPVAPRCRGSAIPGRARGATSRRIPVNAMSVRCPRVRCPPSTSSRRRSGRSKRRSWFGENGRTTPRFMGVADAGEVSRAPPLVGAGVAGSPDWRCRGGDHAGAGWQHARGTGWRALADGAELGLEAPRSLRSRGRHLNGTRPAGPAGGAGAEPLQKRDASVHQPGVESNGGPAASGHGGERGLSFVEEPRTAPQRNPASRSSRSRRRHLSGTRPRTAAHASRTVLCSIRFSLSVRTTRSTKLPGVWMPSGSSSPRPTNSSHSAIVNAAAVAIIGLKFRAVMR